MEKIHTLEELVTYFYEEQQSFSELERKRDELNRKSLALKKILYLLYFKQNLSVEVKELKDLLVYYYGEEGEQYYSKIDVFSVIMEALVNHNMKDTKDYNNYESKYMAIINKINEDLRDIGIEMEKLNETIRLKSNDNGYISAITRDITTKKIISRGSIHYIMLYLKKFGHTKEDIIIMKEQIRKYNFKLSNGDKPFYDTVINMITEKNIMYDTSKFNFDNGEKGRLDAEIKGYWNSIVNSHNFSEISEILVRMPFEENESYSYEYIEYIFLSILNMYITKLEENKRDMLTDNVYDNIELRKTVIEEYKENLARYSLIEKRYLASKKVHARIEEKPKEETDNNQYVTRDTVNNLFYLTKPGGRESYIEHDITSIPYEYLDKIKDLLEELRYGIIAPSKNELFTADHGALVRGFGKLKTDQIRIMYKILGGNNILIIGVKVKKDMRDNGLYYSMAKRFVSYDISNVDAYTERQNESDLAESNLFEYIKQNKRTGNR